MQPSPKLRLVDLDLVWTFFFLDFPHDFLLNFHFLTISELIVCSALVIHTWIEQLAE